MKLIFAFLVLWAVVVYGLPLLPATTDTTGNDSPGDETTGIYMVKARQFKIGSTTTAQPTLKARQFKIGSTTIAQPTMLDRQFTIPTHSADPDLDVRRFTIPTHIAEPLSARQFKIGTASPSPTIGMRQFALPSHTPQPMSGQKYEVGSSPTQVVPVVERRAFWDDEPIVSTVVMTLTTLITKVPEGTVEPTPDLMNSDPPATRTTRAHHGPVPTNKTRPTEAASSAHLIT